MYFVFSLFASVLIVHQLIVCRDILDLIAPMESEHLNLNSSAYANIKFRFASPSFRHADEVFAKRAGVMLDWCDGC